MRNRHLFQQPVSKNAGTIHFKFGVRFGVSQTGAEYGLRLPENEEGGGIFVFIGSELFKNSISKLKM
jgi:hypothetical protein